LFFVRYWRDAVCAALPDVRTSTPVISVKRVPGGVMVASKHGAVVEEYDDVIFACHSDQALGRAGTL
jgi:predicted NAD/FAD-binding protein